MLQLLTVGRAAVLWLFAVLFALFGLWTLGQWWTMLESGAGWQAQLVPMVATIGAVSLARRAAQDARLRPAPLLVRRRRR